MEVRIGMVGDKVNVAESDHLALEHCVELEDSPVEVEDSIYHELEEELEYAAIAYLALPVAFHASFPVVPGFGIAVVVEEQPYEL